MNSAQRKKRLLLTIKCYNAQCDELKIILLTNTMPSILQYVVGYTFVLPISITITRQTIYLSLEYKHHTGSQIQVRCTSEAVHVQLHVL